MQAQLVSAQEMASKGQKVVPCFLYWRRIARTSPEILPSRKDEVLAESSFSLVTFL